MTLVAAPIIRNAELAGLSSIEARLLFVYQSDRDNNEG